MPTKKKTPAQPEKQSASQGPNKAKSLTREYTEALVIAVVLALFIRTFIVQAFKIPSGSMLDTLQIGDHILVNKFIYSFTKPQRGDIIVFKYPEDPKRDFIKRVIGLPGDTLEISNQIVYINGKPLKEPYVRHELKLGEADFIAQRDNFDKLYIPPGFYFMMGDNRDSSMDSRYWGYLKEDMIRGKAFLIYWSISPAKTGVNQPLLKRFINYLVTVKDRIRWRRFGKLIH